MMRLPRRVFSGSSSGSRSKASLPAAVVLGGVLGAATLLSSGVAEAGRVRFSGRAHFSSFARGRVHFARPYWRPRVWAGGNVWVGGYYYPRPYYYYYYPEYVPSYYGSYYPVQPQPQPTAAPGTVAVAEPRPALPTLGIGVFAGGTNVQGQQDSSDVGAMVRIRLTPGLLAEGEIAKTSFQDVDRTDRRIGGSLIYEFGAYNSLAPYVLAGGGVNQADINGSFTTTQDFGEIGVGLRWAVSRNLHLTADIRAGRRQAVDSNQPSALQTIDPSTGTSNDFEDYTRGRLAAVLNF